jgi:hypothetical protein
MLPVLLATLAAAVPTVDCPRHIETAESSAEARRSALRTSRTLDGAIFWGLRRAETQDFDPERKNLGVKAAISVRHGAPLTIKIADGDRDWIALDYDHYDEEYPYTLAGNGEAVTRFVTCAPATPRFSDDGVVGRETSWSGGFIVTRNGCATLLLRRKGEEQWRKLRVGFGERC